MEDQPNKGSCRESVMSRIECEHILPRSKIFFQSREFAVWALWICSVVIGSLAMAVTTFVLTHHEYALYEATHENFSTFLIGALPYLWILTFGVMAFVAVYNLRHTKRGYRYPLWQIFLSSLILSVAGGAVLHAFGMGYVVDHELGRQMPMYESEEKMEMSLWQNPQDGRLIGRVTKQIMPPATMVVFTDVAGVEWMLDVTDLSVEEQALLQREEHVKLIGEVSSTADQIFHSCGAFPWQLDKPMSREDFQATRKAFEMKIRGYGERAEEMAHTNDGDNLDEQGEREESPCGHIAPVRRMGGGMMRGEN